MMNEFLERMDEKFWFRMIVCFLPGLVFIKLASYSPPGSILGLASTVLLLIGVTLYAIWSRLRGVITRGQEGDIDDASSVSSESYQVDDSSPQEVLAILKDLRALCGEGESESLKLVETELAVDPNLSLRSAIRSALVRRRIK